MEKYKILVVEDNIITAKHIGNTLKKFGYDVTNLVDSLKDVQHSIISTRPDLVVLDINLGKDIDGIQIAEILRNEFQIPFIFLTSYNDEKTINRIIKVQPLGYIVKPFNPTDLNAVVELALFKIRSESTLSNIRRNEVIQKDTELNDFIFVKNGRNIDRIPIDQIKFIEADGRYTYIHYDNKKKISNASLKILNDKLIGKHFIQTHRSYIVNLTRVETISLSHLHIGEHEIPVGKTYRNNLLDILNVI